MIRRITLTLILWIGAAPHPAAGQTINIDVSQAGRPFPHFWEKAFGSGRANLSLRAAYRDDLRTVKAATGFEYVRFHAIFHDENGVYDEDAQGRPVYNWSYVDQIYDGLLENRVRPFVELSFMPAKMASSLVPHGFWYKPLAAPPRDYDRWGGLIEAFARHLVERYGIDEVSHWIFEVWNEPNIDFWTGNPKDATYERLYAASAQALKRVSPRLRVGGPSTAQAAWVGPFINDCVKNGLPLDFVSTHVYGNDRSEDVFGTHEKIARRTMVARAVRKAHDEIKASPRPDLPLYFSEFNASYMNEVAVTDSPYIGPWLANTIRLCDGMADIMAYWTFSDVFEEQGVVKTPFYGGFGLIAVGHIPKAAFGAFALLHRLGDVRIPNDSDSALVTRRGDGSLAIALWNYAAPEEAGSQRDFKLNVMGLAGAGVLRIAIVDCSHGSPLTLWESMGKPAFPTPEQQRQLRHTGQVPTAETRVWRPGLPVEITLAPKALALIEIGSQ